MSWYRAVGSGGSSPVSQHVYLYKNGVDNTALTGGLSRADYTFASGWTECGTATFGSDAIVLDCPSTNLSSTSFGTGIKVDLTSYKSIIVHSHDYTAADPIDLPLSIDVTSLSGSYYVGMALAAGAPALRIGVSGSKTNIGEAANIATLQPLPSYKLAIDIIELIPYDKKYLYNKGDECTAVTGGWDASRSYVNKAGYTYGRTVTKNADDILVYDDSNSYSISARTNEKIDMTGYSYLRMRAVIGNGSEFLFSLDVSTINSSYYVYAIISMYNSNVTHRFAIQEDNDIAYPKESATGTSGSLTGYLYVKEVWLEK